MKDLHQYKQRLETASRKIQNSSDICEENKKLAEQFKDWNALRSTSTSRQYRYLSSLKQILEHNDFRLDNIKEDEESKREELAQMTETQKMWEKVETVAVQDTVEDQGKPKKLMTEFFKGIIEEDKEPLEDLEKKIQKGIKVIQRAGEELDSKGCNEEAEEIGGMVESITQDVKLRDLNKLEKEGETTSLDNYSSDQDWSLDAQRSL
jgi:hypothetical protein